jgi:hypothetical protein
MTGGPDPFPLAVPPLHEQKSRVRAAIPAGLTHPPRQKTPDISPIFEAHSNSPAISASKRREIAAVYARRVDNRGSALIVVRGG